MSDALTRSMIPPAMMIEMAEGSTPPQAIAARYGYNYAELEKHPWFRRELAQVRSLALDPAVQQAKALMIYSEALREWLLRLGPVDNPAAWEALTKHAYEASGLKSKMAAPVAQGQAATAFTLRIDLGDGVPAMTLEGKVVPPAPVVDVESEEVPGPEGEEADQSAREVAAVCPPVVPEDVEVRLPDPVEVPAMAAGTIDEILASLDD